jgi:hypothetical protein
MRLVQAGAYGNGAVRVHRAIPLFDMLDFPFLVHHDRRSFRPLELAAFDVIGLQDAIRSQHFLVHVAEQGEGNADFLSEGGIGGGTV